MKNYFSPSIEITETEQKDLLTLSDQFSTKGEYDDEWGWGDFD